MSPSSSVSASPHAPLPDQQSESGARTWTSGLAAAAGQHVTLRGWLHHRRSLKSVLFLILRDATGTAQIVVEDADARRELESLPHESVFAVAGLAVATPQAPDGIEIHDPLVTVVSRAESDPPIELYRPELAASLPARLDEAAVTLRHPKRAMIQRMTAAALDGFRSALGEQRFVEISTPKIVASATEGGANVFALDYFGRPAFLAQSPQLYKQIMVGALERVFETAPAFRAEPHDTARHVSQFLSLDAEMGFIDDHRTVMAVLTRTIRRMIAAIGDLETSTPSDEPVLPDVPATIPEIHFRDALVLIGEATGEDLRKEPDLAPAHERWLGAWAERTHGSEWLYVTGYPMAKRPFYTHPEPGDPRWSNSFDLLFRGLEVVTGGQRLHRYEEYLAALEDRGIDPAAFEGYLAAFRYGMPPHGGFALGVERLIARIAGIDNVRNAILFPRDMQRLTP